MNPALLTSELSILTVIFVIIAISLVSQQFKVARLLGPALIAIVLGILLSNLGLTPTNHSVYGVFFTYSVPLSIAVILLGIDLKALSAISREPFIAVMIAVISVSILSFVSGLFFADKIYEGWKIAGMFVGTYTGGSSNLTAIAMALDASNETIAAANAADYVIGIPSIILFMTLPIILKNSLAFNKFWPYSLSEEELSMDDGKGELLKSKEWSIQDISMLIAIGFVIVWISSYLSSFVPIDLRGSARILMITTFALFCSLIPSVQKLRGNYDLGLFFALTFLTALGLSISLAGFLSSTLTIAIYCVSIVLGCMILQWGISRLFKIKYEYVLLATVAAIADGTAAALVAANAKWKSLMGLALILGVVGGVVGNYLGIVVAFAVKTVMGL